VAKERRFLEDTMVAVGLAMMVLEEGEQLIFAGHLMDIQIG